MNAERIESLLQMAQQAGVGELRVEAEGWSVGFRRNSGSRRASAPPRSEREAEPAPPARPQVGVVSGLVGWFHFADRTLMPGDDVAPGQVLGSIEAMGIPTPVVASEGGRLERVLVVEGQGVQYGQLLFELDASGDGEGAGA
jgi:acetyl-CoA carboxylase biotin carboxyl carrier protein